MGTAPRMDRLFKPPSMRILLLHPYGDQLLTPTVAVWLGFAATVILLMASLEGVVWGLVGASIVPQGAAWTRPLAGLFMFTLMFAIIWIVDASLIMSERPLLRSRRWSAGTHQGVGALLRWSLGMLARVGIVAVSLYVTAPFLAKLIRADDILAYHQRQVEHYYSQRTSGLRTRIDESNQQIRELYEKRRQPLEVEIAQLTQALTEERQRRTTIEAEYAPEMDILRRDLAEARKRVGDEILGRDGRLQGRGPEARKWEETADRLTQQLAAKQAEIDSRGGDSAQRIAQLDQTLHDRSEALRQLTQEQQQRLDQTKIEIESRQLAALPPPLTFAARSQALQALRQSPAEQGVPHFETVEGFAQAALGVLFLSLIALKLFEPAAVRAYFSETMQMQYRKYLDGGLDEIPGFELAPETAKRLNPVEFVRLWTAYERDPTSFYADRQSLIEAQEPLIRYLSEQSLERERLTLRIGNQQQEQGFMQSRRERELAAFDRELSLRTSQLQVQLANETKALRDHRRIELAAQLQQARQDWSRTKGLEEAELQHRQLAFEQEQQLARETLRLREQEIEQLRERSQAEIRGAEVAQQAARQERLLELDLKRQREQREMQLRGIREELSRLSALQTKQEAERRSFSETGRQLAERARGVREEIAALEETRAAQQTRAADLNRQLAEEAAESTDATKERKRSFWSRADTAAESRTAREARRDLKTLEKQEQVESERLTTLRDDLRELEERQAINESERQEVDTLLAATRTRVLFYEDSLEVLLCRTEDTARRGTAETADQTASVSAH